MLSCTKNTEWRNLGKILCTVKCKLENRLRETVQGLEKGQRGAVVNINVLLCAVHYGIKPFPNITRNIIKTSVILKRYSGYTAVEIWCNQSHPGKCIRNRRNKCDI